MMFFSTSHKTGQLGNGTRKYLLAVQTKGRTNAAEFSAKLKTTKQNSASLSPVCVQSSYTRRSFHIESFTLLMCSGA